MFFVFFWVLSVNGTAEHVAENSMRHTWKRGWKTKVPLCRPTRGSAWQRVEEVTQAFLLLILHFEAMWDDVWWPKGVFLYLLILKHKHSEFTDDGCHSLNVELAKSQTIRGWMDLWVASEWPLLMSSTVHLLWLRDAKILHFSENILFHLSRFWNIHISYSLGFSRLRRNPVCCVLQKLSDTGVLVTVKSSQVIDLHYNLGWPKCFTTSWVDKW